MFEGNKEQHDCYVAQMIKNLICDEVAFNLTNRSPIHSWHEGYGLLKEELEEAEESLIEAKEELINLWGLIKMDSPNELLSVRTKILLGRAEEAIHESVHTAAVARKMLVFLEKEKENGTTMAATIRDALK